MPTIVDSYDPSGAGGGDAKYLPGVDSTHRAGQSFPSGGASPTLDSVKFWMKVGLGAPTGNCYAVIASHTGSYGSTSTGVSLLATSDALDVATLTGSYALKTFTFSGAERIVLSDTYYIAGIQYTAGDSSNYISLAKAGDGTGHGGNMAYGDSFFYTASSGTDLEFYVYAADVVAPVAVNMTPSNFATWTNPGVRVG